MAAIEVGAGLVPLVDEGLGNSTYLVELGDGRALVVDPSRDLRTLRAAADARGLRVAFVADTHLHADFLSGARQLAADDGARILASAAGNRTFPHIGLRDADDVDLGGLRLHAVATPGHTAEHLAFVLFDGDRSLGVFTGGSLLVGAAARIDLVAPDRTEALARAQYASLQRLLDLGDDVAVWPTHGAGSFCSAPPGAERTTTIGREKATNPLLHAGSEDAFVAALLGSLGSFPPYFLRLGDANRRGPAVLDAPPALACLDVSQVRALLGEGAELLDVRPLPDVAAGHIPGALSIPLRPAFASWLGWLAPHDRPIIVIRNADQDPAEILWQALKIGYDNLAGGLDAWTAAGHPTATIPLVQPGRLGTAHVLDSRQHAEFTAGHLPGAIHVELGDLPARVDDLPAILPAGPTVVMCGHGERAMGAASLLLRAGRRDLGVLVGGMLGQERTVLPLLAENTFGLTAYTAALTYIVAFGATKAATNYLAGALSDRYGRKPVLVTGWVVAAPVPLLLIWAPTWGWVVAANVLLGVSQGLTWSTTVIMKIDLVGPARRGLAMGFNEAAGYLAVAVTALATGYLAAHHGLRPAPFLVGIVYAALGLGLSTLAVRETQGHARAEAAGHHARPDGMHDHLHGGLTPRRIFTQTSFTEPALSAVSQAGMVNNLNDGLAWGLFPILFTTAGLSLTRIGILAALYPAVWGVGQLATGALSDRIGRKRLIIAGMGIQACALAVVAAGHSFTVWAVAAVLLGAGTAMVYPTLLAAVGDVAHPAWRARAVGVYRLWRDSGFAIGALLAGAIADLAGIPAAIWTVTALTAASGLVVAVRMYETHTPAAQPRRQTAQRETAH